MERYAFFLLPFCSSSFGVSPLLFLFLFPFIPASQADGDDGAAGKRRVKEGGGLPLFFDFSVLPPPFATVWAKHRALLIL